ncbi:MAG: molybdate ABC transporter substrate-binding protein [Myxococcota bacterium]|nr:molybdate ABC transporter substrate-binding protein [Myxococcota bacterium]
MGLLHSHSWIRTGGLLLAVALSACTSGKDGEVTLAAAASLNRVMPALVEQYRAGPDALGVTVSYGSSGGLRQQVEGGAPIDAVVFAHADPVDLLIGKGLARADSRTVVATNQLVLVGPRGGPPLTWQTLSQLPEGELFAVGDPSAVPAGHYARQVLRTLGSWERLRGRMIFGGDVAATLAYVRRGEVAAAAVYQTDVRGLDGVVVLDVARGDWAPRVEVVMAVTGTGGEGAARKFLRFLASPEARPTWRRFGFGDP